MGWKKGGIFAINLSQTSLTNWAAGGQNSVSVNGILSAFANYKQGKSAWDNSLDLGYGILKQGKQDAVSYTHLDVYKRQPLVIGLGPRIVAGVHAHVVIETQRGHHLGSLIREGEAIANTGIPGVIGGYDIDRVLRAPHDGTMANCFDIGDHVRKGDTILTIDGTEVKAQISGVLRGLIAPGHNVFEGQKIGDIDPRDDVSYCMTISDKGRNIAGGVLEAVAAFFAERR